MLPSVVCLSCLPPGRPLLNDACLCGSQDPEKLIPDVAPEDNEGLIERRLAARGLEQKKQKEEEERAERERLRAELEEFRASRTVPSGVRPTHAHHPAAVTMSESHQNFLSILHIFHKLRNLINRPD